MVLWGVNALIHKSTFNAAQHIENNYLLLFLFLL